MAPAIANDIVLGPRGPEIGGSSDWNRLFKDTPEWDRVANRINVYSFTAGYVLQTPDADLKAMAVDLARHHIRTELSAQSVAVLPSDRCGKTEGYSPPEESTAAADKLARLGIRLDHLGLDGALWYGHYDDGPQACRFGIEDVARRAAITVRAYLAHFPDLVLGDGEGLPSLIEQPHWRENYDLFRATLRAETGRTPESLMLDVNWNSADIDRDIKIAADFARQRGMKIGVIYYGGGDTGAAWVRTAIAHFDKLEDIDGLIPDRVFFGTWDSLPLTVLPETAPDALTHAIAVYQRTRTRLSARRDGATISGRLVTEGGAPVAHVPVTVGAVGNDPSRPPPFVVQNGVVPETARFGMLGLRVNMECGCGGPNDLLLGDFVYSEQGLGSSGFLFDLPRHVPTTPAQIWNGQHVRREQLDGQLVAHVEVRPGTTFGFNADVFPVTPGADYIFRAAIAALGDGEMYGFATVFWLDANRQVINRTVLKVPRQLGPVVAGLTDAQGRFALAAPDAGQLDPRSAMVVAAETASTRGASIEIGTAH